MQHETLVVGLVVGKAETATVVLLDNMKSSWKIAFKAFAESNNRTVLRLLLFQMLDEVSTINCFIITSHCRMCIT